MIFVHAHGFTCAGELPSVYINIISSKVYCVFFIIIKESKYHHLKKYCCVYITILWIKYNGYLRVQLKDRYINRTLSYTQLLSPSTYVTAGNHSSSNALDVYIHHSPMSYWKVVYDNWVLHVNFIADTYSTENIIGLSTLSHTEHSFAQTRET